jgi:cyclophilin family peptidyl-prolyl cis-trans isomerase
MSPESEIKEVPMIRQILLTLFVAGSFLAGLAIAQTPAAATKVLMKTSKGDITIELNAAKAPGTVKNFLSYVKDKFYDGTVFHRVIPNFMIQGGGMTAELHEKDAKAPIKNEAANGFKNYRGTIAMARTGVVDSATCQFFINLKDNSFLDHKSDTPDGFGYCVFGKVVAGMDVVDAIAKVKTGTKRGMGDVPLETVTILSVEVIGGK